MAVAEPEPSREEIEALRRDLERRARRHTAPGWSGEDFVQEAWLKVLERPVLPEDPKLRVRLFRKLRDVTHEQRRRPAMRTEDEGPREVLSEDPYSLARPGEELEPEDLKVIELDDMIRHHLGAESAELLRLKRLEKTDSQISKEPGWDQQRTARTRKRLERLPEEVREAVWDELLDQ